MDRSGGRVRPGFSWNLAGPIIGVEGTRAVFRLIVSRRERSSTYFSSLSSQFDDTRVEVLGDVGQVLVQLSKWEGEGRWGKGLQLGLLGGQRV